MGEGGLESSAGILAEAPPIQAEVLLERPEGVVLVVNELDLEGWRPQLYHVSSDDKVGSEERSKGQNRQARKSTLYRRGAHEPSLHNK